MFSYYQILTLDPDTSTDFLPTVSPSILLDRARSGLGEMSGFALLQVYGCPDSVGLLGTEWVP